MSSSRPFASSSTRSTRNGTHPGVESAVTRLLVSIKQLLESLTKWSRSDCDENFVSDVYVRLGNDFNAAVAAFGAFNIDMSEMMSVLDDFRNVLEQCLAEDATPENLELYLPTVRQIITALLQGLRSKQSIYRRIVSDHKHRSDGSGHDRTSSRSSRSHPKQASRSKNPESDRDNVSRRNGSSSARNRETPSTQPAAGSEGSSVGGISPLIAKTSTSPESDSKATLSQPSSSPSHAPPVKASVKRSVLVDKPVPSSPPSFVVVEPTSREPDRSEANFSSSAPDDNALVRSAPSGSSRPIDFSNTSGPVSFSDMPAMSDMHLDDPSFPKMDNQVGINNQVGNESASSASASSFSGGTFYITAASLRYDLGLKKKSSNGGILSWTPDSLVPYHRQNKTLVQQLADVLQSDFDYTAERGNLDNPGLSLRVYHMRCLRSLRHLATKYEILPSSLFVRDLQRIGQNPIRGGGFADIWRGTMGSNQSVCLKVLRLILEPEEDVREKIRKQFCNEALVWRQLKHPNILPLLGVNVELFYPSFCLVSPWMENQDIIAYLKRNPMHNRYDVLSEIASGLLYLHSKDPPVIHGDIRGANVLVTADLHCCLADFGISVINTESQIWSNTTTNIKGATRWMAPELQIPDSAGKLASSRPSTDVYAFGCTIIEILTLKPPFNDKRTDGAIIHSLLVGERPARPQQNIWCTDSLWELMDQCWAQDSSTRPDSQKIYATLQWIRVKNRLSEIDRQKVKIQPVN